MIQLNVLRDFGFPLTDMIKLDEIPTKIKLKIYAIVFQVLKVFLKKNL